jgi:hypothetical protein
MFGGRPSSSCQLIPYSLLLRPSPVTPVPVRRLVLSPPGGLVCSGVPTVPRSKRSRFDGEGAGTREKLEGYDDERIANERSLHVPFFFGMEADDESGLYIIRLTPTRTVEPTHTCIHDCMLACHWSDIGFNSSAMRCTVISSPTSLSCNEYDAFFRYSFKLGLHIESSGIICLQALPLHA